MYSTSKQNVALFATQHFWISQYNSTETIYLPVGIFFLYLLILRLLSFVYVRVTLTGKENDDNSFLSAILGGSVAEWLACWTQAQKGLGSNRSRDAVG